MTHKLALALLAIVLAACSRSELRPNELFRDCPDCPDLVVIPAGSFHMGGEGGEEGRPEGPVREVRFERAFALGRFEVTQRQFATFIADTGYAMRGGCEIWQGGEWRKAEDADWTNPGYERVPFEDEPVACVSWRDATAYVEWLAARTGLPYRLPTEAEWEYAARAGSSGDYFWAPDASACTYANVHDTTGATANRFEWPAFECSDRFPQAAPVGSFEPTAWGLHDMIGNVWEWTADCHIAPYPATPVDGTAVLSGVCDQRAVRGGSWITRPGRQRLSFRGRDPPDTLYSYFGLRIARDL